MIKAQPHRAPVRKRGSCGYQAVAVASCHVIVSTLHLCLCSNRIFVMK